MNRAMSAGFTPFRNRSENPAGDAAHLHADHCLGIASQRALQADGARLGLGRLTPRFACHEVTFTVSERGPADNGRPLAEGVDCASPFAQARTARRACG